MKNENQLQIELKEEVAEGTYSNLAIIAHSSSEFVLDFVRMMPGVNTSALKDAQVDEKALARTEAIIKSMTPKERAKPEILNSSRKRRIAAGSGTSVEEVNRLLKQFDQVKKLMKQFTSMGGRRRGKKMKFPF